MCSEYDGVKFYAKDDRSVGVELQKAEPILASFDASKDYNDVNELLELCACDAGVFSHSNMYCRTQSIIPYADERLEKCA